MGGLVEQEGEGIGPLRLVICYGVAVRRPLRDMFPISNCMGYISMPRDYVGQAQRATPHARLVSSPLFLDGLVFQGPYGFPMCLL